MGKTKLLFSFFSLAVLLVGTVQASSITYVDATPTNTSDAAGLATWLVRGAGSAGNFTSGDSSQFANNGSVLQSLDGGGETDASEIVTEITGLDAGEIYDIYVFYWSPRNNEGAQYWDVSAGLATGVYTSYGSNLGANPANGSAPEAVVNAATTASPGFTGINIPGDDFSDFEDGNRILLYGKVGQVSGVTSQNVFVAPSNDNAGGGGRTWYDGVGFAVVPEPTSVLLTSCAGLICLLRRQRKS